MKGTAKPTRGAQVLSLVFALAARGGSALFDFAFTVVVARALGRDAAGDFFFVLTLFVIGTSIARSGPDVTIVRWTSVHLQRGEPAKAWGLTLVCAAQVAVLGLIVAGATLAMPTLLPGLFANPGRVTALHYVAPVIVPAALMYLFSEGFKGQNRISLSQIFYGGALFFAASASVAIEDWLGVATIVDVGADFAYSALASFALCMVTWALLSRHIWQQRPDFSLHGAVRQNLAMIAVRPLSMLLVWLPNLMLGQFGTEADIAIYTAGLRTSLAVGLILITVESYAAPKIAALYGSHDIAGLRRLFFRLTWIGLLAAGPILLALGVFAGPVLSLFGEGFSEDGQAVLRLQLFGQLANAVTGPVACLLLMTNRENAVMAVQVFTFAVAALAYALLIPSQGAVGAALAYSITLIVMKFSFLIYAACKFRAPSPQ